MKKILVLLFGVVAASQSFAQTAVCPGTTYTAVAGNFVVRSFPVRCSTNVVVTARENAIAFAVGAVSTKGKSKFQGSTGGGAITGAACASPNVCIGSDADNGLAAILATAT